LLSIKCNPLAAGDIWSLAAPIGTLLVGLAAGLLV